MELYVADASVGAKWFLEEELEDEARQLFNLLKEKKARIVVPELFYVEMGSILRRRVQRRTIRYQHASRIQDELTKLPLERYSDHELSDVALENAVQFAISIYDAIYLSLAEIYAAPLVTADDVLIKTCKNRFDFILPLREFGEG